ncbi:hypothetical protein SAMN05216275_15116 [Streptosporangium canum]|uniref:Uncharacterized protein n=1 Tax=Streptosporangium canum TaxID=324952 RepID=A0A1I4EQM6_9ACTN|nr:hypothetical protein [Streptosporangium canum]SFL06786.1 hypothetical protein SAMN05216275_15116 [Streptosporangium canum]
MNGSLSLTDAHEDVRVCAGCGTRVVTLAAAVRMIWADVMDAAIPSDVAERVTAPVAAIWVDVSCNPVCPSDGGEPCPD